MVHRVYVDDLREEDEEARLRASSGVVGCCGCMKGLRIMGVDLGGCLVYSKSSKRKRDRVGDGVVAISCSITHCQTPFNQKCLCIIRTIWPDKPP